MKQNILFLDDNDTRWSLFQQNYPKLLATRAETSDEAIKILSEWKENSHLVFLDHDLGGKEMEWDNNNNGMLVVDFIAMNPDWFRNAHIIIHTYNHIRAPEMAARLTDVGLSSQYIPGVWLKNCLN